MSALDRSLDFLAAQQNPRDGRLPNYGANDGALPSVLSTCDYSDMRPTLQAVSVLVRGRRLYERGPWDEETAWLLGVDALDAPLQSSQLSSRSFGDTGHHVLRGHEAGSFATFRCGTLRDRFSQRPGPMLPSAQSLAIQPGLDAALPERIRKPICLREILVRVAQEDTGHPA